MRNVIMLAAAVSLAGCVVSEPSRVDATTPTVTYKYYGDAYGSQFDQVSAKATDYCGNEFGKSARIRDLDQNSQGTDENFVTFECI